MTDYIQPPNLWPRLLLGPLVRRVEPDAVSVFVATREPMTVQLELFLGVGPVDGSADDSSSEPGSSRTPIAATSTSTIPLGERLHVALVTLSGQTLVPGVLYGYNIALTDGAGVRRDLKLEGLLTGEVPLGYEENHLPGFVLPPERRHLRLVHGSCRKPHGEGVDMFPTIDMLIGDHRLDPLTRPHQLFLTGDQIYADDVAPGLLPALTEAAGLLLGWEERLPDEDDQPTWAPDAAEVEPGARSEFLDSLDVQPKTHYSDNHLLFFGEWCAMYLMAWSNALWAASPVPWHTYKLAGDQLGGTTYSPATRRAVQFGEGLRYVRRAMANVATYMGFDDHEVTDDWNLNLGVSERLRGTPMGRRLVRNALCAYAVFQDWGNQPADYLPGGHGATLLDQLTADISSSPVGAPALDPAVLDGVLDVGSSPATVAQADTRKLWHHTVVGPEHAVLFLDTRTWRSFPNPQLPPGWNASEDVAEFWELEAIGKQLNAALVSSEAMDLQLQALADALVVDLEPPDVRQPIVVSPAPVLGLLFVETLQRAGVIKDLLSGDPVHAGEEYDNEPWGGNAVAYTELLDRLAPFSPVVFLSGDVHYAFSQVAAYDTGSQLARYIQLVSSATRNSLDRANALSVIELSTNLDYGWYVIPHAFQQSPHLVGGLLRSTWDTLRSWDPWGSLTEAVDEAWDKMVNLDFGVFADAKRLVQVICAGPVTYDEARQLVDLWTQSPPPRLMKMLMLIDHRGTTTRGSHDPRLQQELATWNPLSRDALLNRNRGSISINNVGVVSFVEGTPESVQHDLYWRHSDQPLFGADTGWPVVTQHRSQLRQPATPEDVAP